MRKQAAKKLILKWTALALALFLLPVSALGAEASGEDGWVTFFMMCNEGMTNEGGNVGNTVMVVGMKPDTGKIRLMMVTWDTFIQYEGYDIPQLISTPYRNLGPDGTMTAFNTNFGFEIPHFMSLNFLNLAGLIDAYGGVDVDVTRAERNALNGMVASKKWSLEKQADSGLLDQLAIEMMAQEYYLEAYGPDTHLNGLQAVAYGWLQYDSVYNCCERESRVNANLFESVAKKINDEVCFYTNEIAVPENTLGRRTVNLDEMTDDDKAFMRSLVDPIFQKTYHNLTDEEILGITLTLARVAWEIYREGGDIFDQVEVAIYPLEAKNPYDLVAGTEGHLVDYKANEEAMKAFLFAEE